MLVGQLFRFGIVGGIATLVHVVLAVVVERAVNLAPLQANFVGFAGAALFSYLGHAKLTFGRPVGQGDQFMRFAISALVSLATSSGLVWVLTQMFRTEFAVAMLSVGAVVPVITFVVLRFWVFNERERAGQADWTGLAMSAALALATLALFWDRPINHDTAWYLIATRDWLAGAPLYTHIIEVNPPLNFYYTIPALGLAELFGISDKNGQYLFLALVIFAILSWSRAIIRASFDLTPGREALLLSGVAVALVVPALGDFAQRENILVLLTLPWLLGEAAKRPASRKTQFLRGAVAALGICLKPYFLLIPIAVTLFKMRQQKSLRPILAPANLAMVAVGASYVGYVALVHPAYFTDIMPIARDVYGALSKPIWWVVFVVRFPLLFALAALLAGLLSRRDTMGAAPFVAAAAGGLASYLIQGTGFHYHIIPFQTYTLVACAIAIVSSVKRDALMLVAIAVSIGLIGFQLDRGFYKNPTIGEIIATKSELGGADSLIVLSSHVYAGPGPALEGDMDWASRYPHNWLVPGAINGLAETDCLSDPDRCARLESLAARNRSENIADINAHMPDLIVVDRLSGYFKEPRFPWLDFMAEDPAWPAVMARYQQVKETDRFLYFEAIGR